MILLVLFVGSMTGFDLNAADQNKKKLSITIGGGVRNIAAEDFDTIFDGTNICYSLDLSYKVSNNVELFLHSDYLKIDGKTDYTKEDTSFTLIPAELGFRYLLGKKKFKAYFGAGGGFYSYKDEHPGLETLNESQIGFFGEGGIRYLFSGSLFIDLKLKYILLKSKTEDENGDTIDLGGLAYMVGIGFSF